MVIVQSIWEPPSNAYVLAVSVLTNSFFSVCVSVVGNVNKSVRVHAIRLLLKLIVARFIQLPVASIVSIKQSASLPYMFGHTFKFQSVIEICPFAKLKFNSIYGFAWLCVISRKRYVRANERDSVRPCLFVPFQFLPFSCDWTPNRLKIKVVQRWKIYER